MTFTHMEVKTITKEVPHIKFNMDTCLGTLDCGKCLQACVPHVLRCYTAIPEGKTTVSKDWIPVATFPSLCTGCMRCVEVCPRKEEKAITVTFVPTRLPKKIFKRK